MRVIGVELRPVVRHPGVILATNLAGFTIAPPTQQIDLYFSEILLVIALTMGADGISGILAAAGPARTPDAAPRAAVAQASRPVRATKTVVVAPPLPAALV
jgi:hypothetical protein